MMDSVCYQGNTKQDKLRIITNFTVNFTCFLFQFENKSISQNGQYKDVYGRTMEIPQRTHIFKVNCCLKVHSVHLKLAFPISG